MSAWPSSQDAISVSEAAELTGASSKSLRRRIERGTLGSIRQGGRRLIPVSELIRVGLLDASGQSRSATPVYSGAPATGAAASGPDAIPHEAAAAAWAGAAPGGPAAPAPQPSPAPSPAEPSLRPSAAAPVGASPAPSSPRPPAASAGKSPAPAPRSPAPSPQVRAPWSGEPAPAPPQRREYPREVADQAPAPAAAQPPPAGLSDQDRRRIAAMVELVMHQMRTINALNARLTRIEARLDELLGPGS